MKIIKKATKFIIEMFYEIESIGFNRYERRVAKCK